MTKPSANAVAEKAVAPRLFTRAKAAPSSRKRCRRVAPVVNVTLTIEGTDDEIADRFARFLLELTSNTKHPD